MDLLEKLFQPERWREAITRGADKEMPICQLYQMTRPEVRAAMYEKIATGQYRISPPHAALIPKDTPGEYRKVYANEPLDRVLLAAVNSLLFEECRDMIHPACRSYIKGCGAGKTVKDVSRNISAAGEKVAGFKADLSKYFDSVSYQMIENTFDEIEKRTGPSAVIDMLRDYYRCNLYFDTDGTLKEEYKALKQGCAVSSFLADALLYDIDKNISNRQGLYIRYCDDILYIGNDHKAALAELKNMLNQMGLKLNPAKVEEVSNKHFFKFLGFAIRGDEISLPQSRINAFQKEIRARTVALKGQTPAKALQSVMRYLYSSGERHCWAEQVLPVCNISKDINLLNGYILDCLKAVATGKKRIGHLAYKPAEQGCINRSRGRNVKTNREKQPNLIEGYLSLGCAQKAMNISMDLFKTVLNSTTTAIAK